MPFAQLICVPISGAIALALNKSFPKIKQLQSTGNKPLTIGVTTCIVLTETMDGYGNFPEAVKALRLVALCGSGAILTEALSGNALLAWNHVRHAIRAHLSPETTTLIKVSDPAQCNEVIKGLTLKKYDMVNVLGEYGARSAPNQRLKVAFGIDNCFITDVQSKCLSFRKTVNKKLHVEEVVWKDFAAAAKAIAEAELRAPGDERRLFGVVQLMCMKMVRKVFRDIDVNDTKNDEAIRSLAHEVNAQWIRSKDPSFKPGDEPEWAFEKQTHFQETLKQAFPDWSGEGEDNPMNFILPGYETLWRVVLRCFLELTSRPRRDADELSETLLYFLEHPTQANLNEARETDGLSPIMISREVLRLYPPTRRIYRQYIDASGNEQLVAADVETMHRDPNVWGQDAKVFQPARWKDVKEKFRDANFLAFATAPFNCPAKRMRDVDLPFGVTIIAIITAALIRETRGEWVCDAEFPEHGVPLETDREAYADVLLKRVSGLGGDGGSEQVENDMAAGKKMQ